MSSAAQGSMVRCTIQWWIGKLATKVQWGRINYPAKKVGQRYKWLREVDISVPFLICSNGNLTENLDWLHWSAFVLVCLSGMLLHVKWFLFISSVTSSYTNLPFSIQNGGCFCKILQVWLTFKQVRQPRRSILKHWNSKFNIYKYVYSCLHIY